MKRPRITGLFVDDPVIEDNKADFSECEGRHVNHGGGQDGLCGWDLLVKRR